MSYPGSPAAAPAARRRPRRGRITRRSGSRASGVAAEVRPLRRGAVGPHRGTLVAPEPGPARLPAPRGLEVARRHGRPGRSPAPGPRRPTSREGRHRRPGRGEGDPMRTTAWCTLIASLAFGASAQAGVASVWAVADGDKIARDDVASPLRAGNSAWDGRMVRLFGARNEVLAFQVVVEADAKGITALRLSLPELRQRGGGVEDRLRASRPRPHAVRRPPDPGLLGARHERDPRDPRLLGLEAGQPRRATPPGGLAAGPARPRERAPGPRRPSDAGAALDEPGPVDRRLHGTRPARRRLRGEITVRADAETRSLPVELTLFDFALPDENSLHAMVYHEPEQPELYQGHSLDAAYDRFAHRQRVELVHAWTRRACARASAASAAPTSPPRTVTRGRARGRATASCPPRSTAPARSSTTGRAPGAADAWMTFLKATLPTR